MSGRAFEFFLRRAEPVLAELRGVPFAREVIEQTRAEYEILRPEVPDIGGLRNVFQPVMTVNGWIVALHRAMKARGGTAADSVRVCHEVTDRILRRWPPPLLRLLGWVAMSPPSRWYLQAQGRRSQRHEFPADFVWRVERGAGGEVSLVFDECAVNKWYEAQDVRELGPYCNFFDVTYSRLMGMGLDASQTIGLGCEKCALRFKHGRDTPVPETLREVVREK